MDRAAGRVEHKRALLLPAEPGVGARSELLEHHLMVVHDGDVHAIARARDRNAMSAIDAPGTTL